MASSSTSRLPDASLPPIGAVSPRPACRAAVAAQAGAAHAAGARCRSGCSPAYGRLCWALGWSDPKLLPPPHVFIGNIVDQAKFFNTVNRWQIGVGGSGPSPAMAVIYTVLSSTGAC